MQRKEFINHLFESFNEILGAMLEKANREVKACNFEALIAIPRSLKIFYAYIKIMHNNLPGWVALLAIKMHCELSTLFFFVLCHGNVM